MTAALTLSVGCGDSSSGSGGNGGAGGDTGGSGGVGGTGTAQLPPLTNVTDMDAWIAAGHYKKWACEEAEHEAVSPSPHGFNRICSNDVLSAHATPDEYPVDSVGVKELWDKVGGEIVGYAVYQHVKAGTTGDTWFWYEKVPADHPAPHDAAGTVAFGTGDAGPAKNICVGCHVAAGSDAAHGGHDFVYTQVQ